MRFAPARNLFAWIAMLLAVVEGTSPVKGEDAELSARWAGLTPMQMEELTQRHLHGLMRAAHAYADAHGTLPPAVIPNPALPEHKRLSGLVLLLPHLNAESYLEPGRPCFDEQTQAMALRVYNSIDRTKAWDDPVNLSVAKTILPPFLSPQTKTWRTDDGLAVTHFAFVRGSDQGPDGAFPGDVGIGIREITDGTSVTLGIGQIDTQLGPWIAAGTSTARQLHLPLAGAPGSFASPDKSGAWFAVCDGTTGFFKLKEMDEEAARALATRAGGEFGTNVQAFIRQPAVTE